jgi:hypothetical protein
MATCLGPATDKRGRAVQCSRPPVADGLCASHYRQARRLEQRGEPVVLRSLGERGRPKVLVQARVTQACAAVLADEARQRPRSTVSEVAREALESWARRATRKRSA